jgi:hypothetical protein
MHRSHGTLPVSGGRPPRRGRGAASAKGCASSGLPATPEALRLTEAFCAGVRHSPRFAAAAAAPEEQLEKWNAGEETVASQASLYCWSGRIVPHCRTGNSAHTAAAATAAAVYFAAIHPCASGQP